MFRTGAGKQNSKRGAWRFVRTRGLILLILLVMAWLTQGDLLPLAVMELVSWIPFLLATSRGIAFRATVFLYGLAIICIGISVIASRYPGFFSSMYDSRLLITALVSAISLLLIARQLVYVFKNSSRRRRIKSRVRIHFSMIHIMHWTIAVAIIASSMRFLPENVDLRSLFGLGVFHGVVIALSVAFSVWFWLSPGPVSSRVDGVLIGIVLMVPVIGILVFFPMDLVRWICGLSLASLPYAMYLIWVCNMARKSGIAVGSAKGFRIEQRNQLPKQIDVMALEGSVSQTNHEDTNRWS